MESKSTIPIVDIQRYDGGVLVVFEDGRSAVYSAPFLRELLPQAHDVTVAEEEDD